MGGPATELGQRNVCGNSSTSLARFCLRLVHPQTIRLSAEIMAHRQAVWGTATATPHWFPGSSLASLLWPLPAGLNI